MITNVMRRVYLDNNATSPVDPLVLKAMLPFYEEAFGNAASIHAPGQTARTGVEEARGRVASLLGAETSEIVFTSGGTEADNAAIRGVAAARRTRGDHIITTTIEHPAVLRTCEQLEAEGFRVTYLDPDVDGLISVSQVEQALSEDTILISVMYANNEVGSIQPLREIGRIAREGDVVLHTDAVQAVGKIPVDVKQLGVDLLSLSAHKFHGPKGVGALFIKSGLELKPFMLGGSHERGRRAGTENVPGIVGLGEAARRASESLQDFGARVGGLRDRLEEGILEQIPDTVLNGPRDNRVPHTSSISFDHLEGETLLIGLDFQGIAVSTGAACSSGSLQPSHVLTAMKLSPRRIQGAIRFSLSRMTTAEDIDYVLQTLPAMVEKMREMSVRR